MNEKYPRYELTVAIGKRLSINDSELMVHTTTGIPDIKDREAITQAAIGLVDFALFEGWDEVLNENP